MIIDRDKHNKYVAGWKPNYTVPTNQGSSSGTNVTIIYGGGGSGSSTPVSSEAFSYYKVSDGENVITQEAKVLKDIANLSIIGDEGIKVELITDPTIFEASFTSTGINEGVYKISYGKVTTVVELPTESETLAEEPIEPEVVITFPMTITYVSGEKIKAELFDTLRLLNDTEEVATYPSSSLAIEGDADGILSISLEVYKEVLSVDEEGKPVQDAEGNPVMEKLGLYFNRILLTSLLENQSSTQAEGDSTEEEPQLPTYESLLLFDVVVNIDTVIKLSSDSGAGLWKLDDNGNIYTEYNAYSLKELSAYGPGEGEAGEGVGFLHELGDVSIPAPNEIPDNAILQYNIETDKWEAVEWSELDDTATREWVELKFKNLINGAPADLDTLGEIAIVIQELQQLLDWFSFVDGRIRANYDFWGVGEISAYGPASGSDPGTGGGAGYLHELGDVTINNDTLTDGLIIVWNEDSLMWVNVDFSGLDEGALALYLTQNKYATLGWVNSQLDPINNKLEEFQTTIDMINDMFEWDSGKIKAKATLYSVGEISAYGAEEGSSSIVGYLHELEDVLLTDLLDDLLLMYDATIGKWINVDKNSVGLNETELKQYLTTHKYVTSNQVVLPTRRVIAGTGLTGGGALSSDVTLSLATSGVTSGVYTKVTVDLYGRVTLGASLVENDIPNIAWSKIHSTPTTLAGYGITDAYTMLQSDERYVNVTGDTMTGNLILPTLQANTSIILGSVKLEYDSASNALKISNVNTQQVINLYATGEISAYGYNEGSIGGGASTLNDLDDVTLSNPLNGQALVYNSSTGQWVNTTILAGGIDEEALAAYLTNNQYVTQQWVTSQNYLTTVSLETISDLHSSWDALLKAAPSAYVTRWPTAAEVGALTQSTGDARYALTTGTNASGTWPISITGDAQTFRGYGTNSTWGGVVVVRVDGVAEMGRYIDFHYADDDSNDYSIRLQVPNVANQLVSLPSSSGTIALTTSNVYSATKLQTAQKIWGQPFDGTAPVSGDMTGVGNFTGVGQFKYGASDESNASYGKYHRLNLGYHSIDHTDFYEQVFNFFSNGGGTTWAKIGSTNYFNGNVGIGTTSPSYKLHVVGGIYSSEYIQIGSGRIKWDSSNNALYVEKSDGTAIGFYSKGFISAKGANDDAGGSASGVTALSQLSDVSLGTLATNQVLSWNGSKWVNKAISTGLDETALAQYLTNNQYLTMPTGDARYVNLTGDTMTGRLTISTSGRGNQLLINNTAGGEAFFYLQSAGVNKAAFTTMQPNYGTCIFDSTSSKYLGIKTDGTPHFQGNTLWHAGNDGSGSGLDADLLDGYQGSSYDLVTNLSGIADNGMYVIGLLQITDYTTKGNQARGRLIFTRNNGNNAVCTIFYDLSTAYNTTNVRFGYLKLGSGVGQINPCTFTYNGKKWAGFTMTSPSNYSNGVQVMRVGLRIGEKSTPFLLRYKTSNTGAINNSEVNNSLVTNGSDLVETGVSTGTFYGNLSGNAATATTATQLQTAHTINGTAFNGTSNIVTNYWGTARTLSLTGNATGSVSMNGSSNVSMSVNVNYATSAGNADTVDGKHVGVSASQVTQNFAFPSFGSFGSATDNASYYTNIEKWIQTNYSGAEAIFFGKGNPNSQGILIGHKYSNAGNSAGFPQYCSFLYSSLGGIVYTFGTNNYSQYTYQLARTVDNVYSATKLQTSQKIWGQPFNGTAPVSGNMTEVGDISFNGSNRLYWKESGYGDQFAIVPAFSGTNDSNILQFQSAVGEAGTTPALTTKMVIAGSTGNVGIGTTSPSYKLHVAGDIYATSWLRTNGQAGWYSQTYGGGIYMNDSTWVRLYGSKSFYAGNGIIRTDYLFDRQGYNGSSWYNGYGAYNVAVTNNNSQTPLLLAYRSGQSQSVTGANRLFSMELLNSGTIMYLNFGGAMKYSLSSAGVFYARSGMYSDGYVSAKGNNSSSDIRLKNILCHIRPSLKAFAKAPLFKFAWKSDPDMVEIGSSAQYWKNVLPDTVKERDGWLEMGYGNIALAGVITIARDFETLEQRVDRLEKENGKLKKRIKELERRAI